MVISKGQLERIKIMQDQLRYIKSSRKLFELMMDSLEDGELSVRMDRKDLHPDVEFELKSQGYETNDMGHSVYIYL